MPATSHTPLPSDFRLLSTGTGASDFDSTAVVAHVTNLLLADIKAALGEACPTLSARANQAVLRATLTERLSRIVVTGERSRGLKHLRELPIQLLTPVRAIKVGSLGMSVATLYRAIDSNRFYCVVPPGQKNGRLLPAWQFVSTVPELLPAVLQALSGRTRAETHAFLVSRADELNELAPAEMLAGMPFETNTELEPSQARLLGMKAAERLARVLELVELGFRGSAHD